MKAKIMKVLKVCAFVLIFSGTLKAQVCPINFANSLSCGGSVTIRWTYISCPPVSNCSISAPTVVGGGVTIPCSTSCNPFGGLCNIRITVLAINGCTITPTSIDWLAANNTPGGVLRVPLPCPTGICPPPLCCDLGTIIELDAVNLKCFVN